MVQSNTRREFLKSTSATTLGVTGATASNTKSGPKILFEESFEPETPTKFSPAALGKDANPGIVEAPGAAVDGEYMLRMGRVSSTKTTSSIELPTSDPFEISVHIAPLTRGDYVPDTGVVLSNNESKITLFQMIEDAKGNRTLGINNIELGEFKTDSWNHVQVRFESSEEEVQISYTIDGEERGGSSIERELLEEDIHLGLFVGYPTVLWDNITIIQNPDTRNQGLFTSGSLFDAVTTIGSYLIQAVFFILLILLGIRFLNGLAGDPSSSESNTEHRSTQGTKKSKPNLGEDRSSGEKISNNGSSGVRTNKYGELIDDDQK